MEVPRSEVMKKRSMCFAVLVAVLSIVSIKDRPAQAYVEIPYTLGRVINEATNIVVVKVEKVDKERNLIIFSKVADLKGKHPTDTIKHNIGRGGVYPRGGAVIKGGGQPRENGGCFSKKLGRGTCLP